MFVFFVVGNMDVCVVRWWMLCFDVGFVIILMVMGVVMGLFLFSWWGWCIGVCVGFICFVCCY